jgi:hypothetical protein
MAIYYSDLYANLLTTRFLEPGEKILERARAQHAPWFAKLLFWLKKDYLLVATTRRFIIFTHKCGLLRPFGLTSAEAHPWNALAEVTPKGLVGQKLRLRAKNGWKNTFKLSSFFVERGSRKFSRGVAQAWEQGRALPAGRPAA